MIQINPLKSYIDGGVRAALTTPPSASLVFDLPGKAIWVKGVKLKGTDHTYTFSHDNYITLTNTPDSNESEDIKIGVNTSALKSAIDTTYGVVSTTANGLAPKFISGNKLAAAAATTYYFLGWAGSTLKWYQAPFRNIRINSETTDCLGVNNTDPLIISSGNGISVTWDSTNKKIIITNTKPDVNHNTDTKVALSVTTLNKNYAVILKGNDSDEGSITTVNFSTYLKFNPSTKLLTINGSKVITTIDTFVGATTSTDGSVGLVTKPLIANRLLFLRGDGIWATPTNTWRPVKVEGTEKLGSNALDLSAGNGISIIYNSDTKKIVITNTKPDVNHNTDRTGIKLATVSGTKKTDSTLILANSTTGLNIQGGTNKFLIGNETNYIEVPITPSFTVTNKDATIGTALTTIATIAGVDIKAKIASYSLSNHTHLVKINGSTKTIAASGAVDLGNYLPLSGGTMSGTAWIVWPDSGNWGNNNSGVTFPVIRGGLEWSGQSDYVKLFTEETSNDNLNLVLQFGDDNSNGLSIRNASNVQTSYISAGGVITTGTFKGNLDWSYITNKPATATRWPSWAEVTGKPSSFTPSTHTHGLSNSVFFLNMPSISGNAKWKEVFGYPVNYNLLLSVRINNPAPEWCVGNFGSGILYGGSDTKGFMSSAYNEPLIMWAGGNGSSDDSVPKWYIGIKGIHKSIYNLATIASEANAAYNLRHSHSNKSVLDGITSALVNNWNTAYNFVNTITGTDTDKVINKWDEIVNFLAGISEDNKLNTLLNSKLSILLLSAKDILTTKTNNALFWVDTKGNASTITTGPFTDHPYALLSVTNYNLNTENSKFFYRSRLAFSSAGDIKVASCHHENEYQLNETWYNVLTSNNSGISGSTIKLNGTSITVYSSSTSDSRYVKKAGDTMTGALNFANNTWNKVGDDSYVGDCNISGHFGIKAANTTYPGIAFFNNSGAHLGNLTAYNGNIKYGAYSLRFLDNGNTNVGASTWTNPFSSYNSNAVADGQAICVWGQSSSLSNLASDSGDMSLWLKRINANAATLNMVLDGEYYANGNLRLAHISEIPTSLKNPYALTISLNGTSQGPYDGSAAKNINITPSSIGAATSNHNHDGRYVRYYAVTTLDCNNLAVGLTAAKVSATNAAHTNHSTFLYISDVGTPFQIQIPDSSVPYIYKRYYSSGKWSGWFKLNAGYADSAGSATKLQTARTLWGQLFDGTGNVSGFMRNVSGLTYQGTLNEDWSDGNNTHPWYGIDYRHCIDSSETGKAYTSISSYFGLYFKTGGSRFIFDGGNVGIGTTSPVEKLDINGNIISRNIRIWGNEVTNNSKGLFIQASDKTNRAFLTYNGNVENTSYLNICSSFGNIVLSPARNVGIGATTPAYKLHVAGDIYTTTGFKKNGSSDSYVLLGGGGHKLVSDFSTSAQGVGTIISISKSLTPTTSWIDTGIKTDSATFPGGNGSYIVQISVPSSSGTDGWGDLYTGYFSLFTGTDSSTEDEILLHGASHALLKRIYLKTKATANTDGTMHFYIASEKAFSAARTINFKFRKLI